MTLYFVFGFLYFLSTVTDWLYVSYISKPFFIGALCFYYIEESKKNVNYYNCTVLVLLFLSGIINLLEGYDYFVYVLLLNLLAYCLLFFQVLKYLNAIPYYKFKKIQYFQLGITIIFLASLLYIPSFLVFDSAFELYKLVVVYGSVLTLFVLCTTFNYIVNPSPKNMYLLLYVFDIVIGELFYGIYHYYHNFMMVRYLSVFCYILSFYFLVKYFLKENNPQTKE